MDDKLDLNNCFKGDIWMHDIGHCAHYLCPKAGTCHRQLMYNKALTEGRTYIDVLEPREEDLKGQCSIYWPEENEVLINKYNILNLKKGDE